MKRSAKNSRGNLSTDTARPTVAPHTARANDQGRPRPTPEEIARRAFEIYEREGRPEGRALAHWVQAEADLTATDAS